MNNDICDGSAYSAAWLKSELQELGVDPAMSVVAVSGGADSLALLVAMAEIGAKAALTVDHGLRSEAAEEAAFVKACCDGLGIKHHTLTWNGEKPSANIQADARDARYALMENWCADNGYAFLLTAHHQGDQAETFFQRLARGSGIYGLAAMRAIGWGRYRPEIKRVKPLLDLPKSALVDYLKSKGINWVEDPSNQDPAYDRVKIREFLANPPLEGLVPDRIAATAKRLSRARAALNHYINRWIVDNVKVDRFGVARFSVTAFEDVPEEIILRSFASLIQMVGGADYVPRFEKLEALMAAIRIEGFSGATLGGVQFISEGPRERALVREFAAISDRTPLKESSVWDKRFSVAVESVLPRDFSSFYIRPLGDDGWQALVRKAPQFQEDKPPLNVRRTIPAIYDANGLRSVPLLGYDELTSFGVKMSLIKNHISKK